MPFKPKPPPVILAIESLSDGREIRPSHYRDELNGGKMMPIPQDPRPPRVMKSGNELLSEIKQKEIDTYAKVLVKAGLGDLIGHKPEPKLVAPIKPGMRPVGKLGDKLVMSIPANPIRRGY
jgi:hypothetical protein